MIDLELTPDQHLLVQTVREFMAKEFAPYIQDWDYEHTYNPDTFARTRGDRPYGLCFPEEFGGSGYDYISLGLASEELE